MSHPPPPPPNLPPLSSVSTISYSSHLANLSPYYYVGNGRRRKEEGTSKIEMDRWDTGMKVYRHEGAPKHLFIIMHYLCILQFTPTVHPILPYLQSKEGQGIEDEKTSQADD